VVRQWFNHIQFHPFLAAQYDYVGLTEDPKRNGVMLAALVAFLVPESKFAVALQNPA